ncbi:hypothetical protein EI427_12895 [Flammeovirga pectinis]|uniref:Tetratricopeptide repeat protein n=1 Tax=Flammeovirga pectinis TaxID=2494373 RepID=A0A3S9P4T7_9BACT|nr:hypothetical protein [Flammeovirga pectinis]AZQ63102.1 hypothetical protein EI427_12895 [Flammeovirga pectinis]
MKYTNLYCLTSILILCSTLTFAQKRTSASAANITFEFAPLLDVINDVRGIERTKLITSIDPITKSEKKTILKEFPNKEFKQLRNDFPDKSDQEIELDIITEAQEDTLYKYQGYLNLSESIVGKGNDPKLLISYEVVQPKAVKVTNSFKGMKGNDTALFIESPAILTFKKGDKIIFQKDISNEKYLHLSAADLIPNISLKSGINKAISQDSKLAIAQEFVDKEQKWLLQYSLKYAIRSTKEQLTTRIEPYMVSIYAAKSRHKSADQLEEIQENLSDAIKKMYTLSKKKKTTLSDVKVLFNEAIPVWEKVLVDANYEDKKAEINAEIADGLHLNCALGYLVKGEYDKGISHLDKIEKSFQKDSAFSQTTTNSMFGSFNDKARKLRQIINMIKLDPNKVTVTSKGSGYM